MSRHLESLALGDTMWFKGPKGRFNYVPNIKQSIGASMQLPQHAGLSQPFATKVLLQCWHRPRHFGWPGADG